MIAPTVCLCVSIRPATCSASFKRRSHLTVPGTDNIIGVLVGELRGSSRYAHIVKDDKGTNKI